MLARTALFLSLLIAPGLAAPPETPTTVTFGSTAAQVGDAIEQDIRLELRLKALVRRGAEVLDESETTKVRAHHRRVTTTEVAAGRSVGVEVAYGKATEKVIAGKTYRCRREGDQLRITDTDGAIPPLSEFEVVARHMQMLGRRNPLAAFLRGKTIAVGQTVEVPTKVAAELFGPELFGDTNGFRLRLTGVEAAGQTTLARFGAVMNVVASDGTQTRMEVAGPMAVDAGSGRLVSAELLGPIAMNQSRHDPGGPLQVSATGRFTVSLNTKMLPVRTARSRARGLLRF